MRVALLATVIQEERYLPEWIVYNLSIGFDHIYLYDNASLPTVEAALSNFPSAQAWGLTPEELSHVTCVHCPGAYVIPRAYNVWSNEYGHLYDAVALFDPDEFLVLHKHKNVKHLLEEHLEPYGGALSVNWYLFGNSGIKEDDGSPGVVHRFMHRGNKPQNEVKTISWLKDVHSLGHAHFPTLIQGKYQRDTSNKEFRGAFNPSGPMNVCQLNHYYCKTNSEWLKKRNRGQGDHPPSYRHPLVWFDNHNLNETYDDTLWKTFQELGLSDRRICQIKCDV